MLHSGQTMISRQLSALLLASVLCASNSGPLHAAARRSHRPARRPAPVSLQKTIDRILADPAVARAHWGIEVTTLEGKDIYALNSGQFFEPASNAKLFTTAAALALLGPQFTMKTYVVAEGKQSSDGHLRGTLRLIGGGDPTLSGRSYPYNGHTERPDPPLGPLDDLAAQVAAHGIRTLDGTVIADDTLFTYERYGEGWAWDDLQWDYGAPVSALTVNDNVRYLTITPGAQLGDKAVISWNPDAPGGEQTFDAVNNQIITSPARSQPHIGLDREPGQPALRAFGTIPLAAQPSNFGISLEDPAQFAGNAFIQSLNSHGVAAKQAAQTAHRLSGDTMSFNLEVAQPLALRPALNQPLPFSPSAGQSIVAERTSPPLSQIVTVVNKVSQNQHAETLLRLLGVAQGDGGSVVQGARVVRQFLIAAGVNPEEFHFVDGSGLSSDDLVTPHAVATLLAYASHQSWGEDYRNSLPIGGVDGTLSGRFLHSTLRGQIFAKTGTLSEVSSTSGYLTTRRGKTLVFSVLCNDHVGEGSRKAIDEIIEAIAAAN